MYRFRDAPIRWKLIITVAFVGVAGLVPVGVTILLYERSVVRSSLVMELDTMARVIGSNSTAALTFDDPQAARSTLAALSAHGSVIEAGIYARDGQLYASYVRGEKGAGPPHRAGTDGWRFEGDRFLISRPILFENERIGTIYIAADMSLVRARLRLYVLLVTSVVAFSGLLAMLLALRLQRVISSPILQLADAAHAVAEKKDYSVRVPKENRDEIGTLVDSFNEMVNQVQLSNAGLKRAHDELEQKVEERTHELKQAQLQLVETARRVGMAEIATNVLHNVGNILNSINVSASLIGEKLQESRVGNLRRIAELLQRHQTDAVEFLSEDPKGSQIPVYLERMAEMLVAERAEITNELEALRRNLEHMKTIIILQQSYAGVAGVEEEMDLVELMEDALRINQAAIERERIRVTREYADMPPIRIDRHRTLQILVNLISNARYAVGDVHDGDRLLTLRIQSAGEERVRLEVSDNGVGIPPENLTRVFQYGFTTRESGHGFGLHGSANAARDMGGSLEARSPGAGQGATFVLELPITGRK